MPQKKTHSIKLKIGSVWRNKETHQHVIVLQDSQPLDYTCLVTHEDKLNKNFKWSRMIYSVKGSHRKIYCDKDIFLERFKFIRESEPKLSLHKVVLPYYYRMKERKNHLKKLENLTMNRVDLIGRLGKKPELTKSKDGMSIAKFTIATEEGYGDKKRTDWHRIVCFGKTADTADKFLTKGSLVRITGSIKYNEWTDDKDVKRNSTDILVREIEFLFTKPKADSVQPAPATDAEPAVSPQAASPENEEPDEDIPF